MNDSTYERLRASVIRDGHDPTEDKFVLDVCEDVVKFAVTDSKFPSHYSPTGVWDSEGMKEVLAAWLCDRAVGRGQLKALIVTSRNIQVFRAQVKTSVRQSIIDNLRRTQARNLFSRIKEVLEASSSCQSRGSGNNAFWSVDDDPDRVFEGDDRDLLNVAYTLGDFEEIRYNPTAKKLSPLLERDDLERFALGMLAAGSMTVGTINRAVCLRFNVSLSETQVELTEHQICTRIPGPEEEAVSRDLAIAAADEISPRQLTILRAKLDEKSGSQIAEDLECSEATVSMETANIRAILARTGADDPNVLKKLLEGEFKEADE